MSLLQNISRLSLRTVHVRHFSVTNASKSNIGFIGLGNMGNHMAKNLMKKGESIVVFDISKESVNSLTTDGEKINNLLRAQAASSPSEVAANCEKIITMLPSNPHVKEVYTGNNGILSGVKKGSLLLDSSTIDPAVSRHVGEQCQAKGASYMDCPVSGGVNAARDGILTFMVGGDSAKFEEAKSILEKMGKNIIQCGELGTGNSAKICNNMLLAISMIGTSETMNLGVKLGLKPELLAQILNMSTGRCWSSELYNPYPGILPNVPSSNDYQGGFGSALMRKDLGLSQDAASATKSATPLGKKAFEIYSEMSDKGFGQKDFSSALKFIQDVLEKQ
ncbi:DgyrCDS2054 [Dimorphilus gyrociliatus]|uniref:3-hydroxyisobutyrate dehydrogenase n=1 Tax=Dimorphilus gyrociliatus TaxID=2664684 RepID=A0A7I8VBX5_9ANNE|nr:DgyrCDS2054 [Dimorphilus gyrociliatus]